MFHCLIQRNSWHPWFGCSHNQSGMKPWSNSINSSGIPISHSLWLCHLEMKIQKQNVLEAVWTYCTSANSNSWELNCLDWHQLWRPGQRCWIFIPVFDFPINDDDTKRDHNKGYGDPKEPLKERDVFKEIGKAMDWGVVAKTLHIFFNIWHFYIPTLICKVQENYFAHASFLNNSQN